MDKKVNMYFPVYLEEYLIENKVKYLKNFNETILSEFFYTFDYSYRDASDYSDYYHRFCKENNENCVIISYENDGVLKNSLFDVNTMDIDENYLSRNIEYSYFSGYLSIEDFNEKIKLINLANYEINVLCICPKVLKKILSDFNLKLVADIVNEFTFIDYTAIPGNLVILFNDFLETLKLDVIETLQKDFIEYVTSGDQRIFDVLYYRRQGVTYAAIAKILKYSDEWIRQLDNKALISFKHNIISNKFSLYELSLNLDKVDPNLINKYFGRYAKVFNYLYQAYDI